MSNIKPTDPDYLWVRKLVLLDTEEKVLQALQERDKQQNEALLAQVAELREGISRFQAVELAGSMSMYGVNIGEYNKLKDLIRKYQKEES